MPRIHDVGPFASQEWIAEFVPFNFTGGFGQQIVDGGGRSDIRLAPRFCIECLANVAERVDVDTFGEGRILAGEQHDLAA